MLALFANPGFGLRASLQLHFCLAYLVFGVGMDTGDLAYASLRLYVGGFPANTPVASISRLFERIKGVIQVEDVSHTVSNAYCHVQLTLDVDPADLAKRCSIRDRIIKVYNKTKWKGGRLKVEEAKPDFRSRAQAEEIEKNDTPEVGDMDEISDNEYENALQKKDAPYSKETRS